MIMVDGDLLSRVINLRRSNLQNVNPRGLSNGQSGR